MVLEKLKEFRKRKGYTKRDLSKKAGIASSTYYDKEEGKTSFKTDEFIRIVIALNLDRKEVLELLELH
ncbi:helix-turn-helix domain-containing protein [Clostridioides difficile]|uniref:helix-turn-helix domain-containing protein n=1 Tax=Clostridioides difficile TaxID=1496 RepID=UPI0013EFB5FC|nr:helix-turn-helix transcriptional regulator [Clostridioides difficile]MDM9944051.1 helix-turn-helix transcriptional regulator [Clostridioides difficile]